MINNFDLEKLNLKKISMGTHCYPSWSHSEVFFLKKLKAMVNICISKTILSEAL